MRGLAAQPEEAAGLLALPPLVVLTDLALRGVLPLHRGVHLQLQLLRPVGQLDGDLQPHGLLVEEGELAVGLELGQLENVVSDNRT